MGQLQKYQPFTLDDVAEAEKIAPATGGKFIKPKVGKNIYRFLPGVNHKPFLVTYSHYIKRPGLGDISTNCPAMMAKQPCPICKERNRLLSTGKQLDANKADKMKPRLRVYSNVIDRSDPDAGPQPFAFGAMIWNPIKALLVEEQVDVTNPDADGYDFVVTRVGTGETDTKYSARQSAKPSALSNPEWIDQQADLSRFARIPSEAEILAQINGDAPQEDLDAEPPPVRRGLPAASRSLADEALDADEVE